MYYLNSAVLLLEPADSFMHQSNVNNTKYKEKILKKGSATGPT